jgi:hypothetical protein
MRKLLRHFEGAGGWAMCVGEAGWTLAGFLFPDHLGMGQNHMTEGKTIQLYPLVI